MAASAIFDVAIRDADENFHYGAAYQGIKAIRDACCLARLVTAEGV